MEFTNSFIMISVIGLLEFKYLEFFYIFLLEDSGVHIIAVNSCQNSQHAS